MVKREATPPIEEDCKYFIINYPYPLYANVQVEEERHDLACWIASCIGPQYLAALYYKPSVRKMLLLASTRIITEHWLHFQSNNLDDNGRKHSLRTWLLSLSTSLAARSILFSEAINGLNF